MAGPDPLRRYYQAPAAAYRSRAMASEPKPCPKAGSSTHRTCGGVRCGGAAYLVVEGRRRPDAQTMVTVYDRPAIDLGQRADAAGAGNG